MKEFWLWVAIVTLILALLCATLVAVFHVDKQLRKTEAILLRAEKFEKDGQPACALTAYLEAQRLYPPSSFAKDGIIRITRQIEEADPRKKAPGAA